MTADAIKRIEAIESLEDLGAGFLLASHDLEFAAPANCSASRRAARSTRSVSACTWNCWNGLCKH